MKTGMKKCLALTLAGVMSLGLLASCGGESTGGQETGSQGTESPAAGEVTYADTIVIGDNDEPNDLDPDQAWGAAEAWCGRMKTARSPPCWPRTGRSARTA